MHKEHVDAAMLVFQFTMPPAAKRCIWIDSPGPYRLTNPHQGLRGRGMDGRQLKSDPLRRLDQYTVCVGRPLLGGGIRAVVADPWRGGL